MSLYHIDTSNYFCKIVQIGKNYFLVTFRAQGWMRIQLYWVNLNISMFSMYRNTAKTVENQHFSRYFFISNCLKIVSGDHTEKLYPSIDVPNPIVSSAYRMSVIRQKFKILFEQKCSPPKKKKKSPPFGGGGLFF